MCRRQQGGGTLELFAKVRGVLNRPPQIAPAKGSGKRCTGTTWSDPQNPRRRQCLPFMLTVQLRYTPLTCLHCFSFQPVMAIARAGFVHGYVRPALHFQCCAASKPIGQAHVWCSLPRARSSIKGHGAGAQKQARHYLHTFVGKDRWMVRFDWTNKLQLRAMCSWNVT
ncbi:hypothetical protein M404DRAFT_767721 [Pisolithus tinctorius Marx 270]|uniref:Uncharacterized protein n=1 Tax=Pisolithus tinctorius Marx 270 TaxID=870435 RepID=A0A0C3NYR4_PISTI|nr:hypothetical protein M404DRAFT_767721 [Pisolithus tinctorius Marx 270]